MKKTILEFLIRKCAREVIKQLKEGQIPSMSPQDSVKFYIDAQGAWCKKCGSQGKLANQSGKKEYSCINKKCNNHKEETFGGLFEADKFQGITAPPADGQGTADQPAIPKERDPLPTTPSQPETPKVPEIKGVVFVNPNNKAKLQKVKTYSDDAALEKSLYDMAAAAVGPTVKIAISTIRTVKNSLKSPNIPLYLYIGKYDPDSNELFLLADKNLQVAKDSSIPPEELIPTTPSVAPGAVGAFDPLMAGGREFGQQLMNKGRTIPTGLNEELVKLIRNKVKKLFEIKQ
jgi:hypothetical protein